MCSTESMLENRQLASDLDADSVPDNAAAEHEGAAGEDIQR